MKLDNGAWVLVADGAKALTLVNDGDADILNLRRVTVKEEHHARTADMGTDRPGRTHQSGTTMRSGMEQTDWHDLAEKDFVRGVARTLDVSAREGRFSKLLVIAAPRALAELRSAFGADVQNAIVGELAKDLTGHPIPEIEKAIAAA
jgi:protein required for attachment to host cells